MLSLQGKHLVFSAFILGVLLLHEESLKTGRRREARWLSG